MIIIADEWRVMSSIWYVGLILLIYLMTTLIYMGHQWFA